MSLRPNGNPKQVNLTILEVEEAILWWTVNVRKIRISTIHLYYNQYETMVFTGDDWTELEGATRHYYGHENAKEGHKKVVKQVVTALKESCTWDDFLRRMG